MRVAARRREWEAHLWDHTADVFQQGFDVRRPLEEDELTTLTQVVGAICSGAEDAELAALLRRLLLTAPKQMHVLMQIAGLTRNKIITDLKAHTAGAGFHIPGSALNLMRTDAVWAFAGPYLALRLRRVLQPLCEGGMTPGVLESINQSTWPHWIRQERAKRQGHQAEYRIAVLLAALGIPFVPREKADNPLSRDATVKGISFDIVSPDIDNPLMCVKSTVQTSNIGQFGESKGALEVVEAREMVDAHAFPAGRPVILAMVDGVGFRSNTAGLTRILETADEFCQFDTLWKAAVVAAHLNGMVCQLALEQDHFAGHDEFLETYDSVRVAPLTPEFRAEHASDGVEAGEGLLVRL